MKWFERLVNDHITSTAPDTLDPFQFAYHPNRSTDDAIAIALHTALSHLDKRNTYVIILFIDYSSAFNPIVPSKLLIKPRALGLNPTLCNCVLDFLMGRPQVVKVGNNTYTSLILNTGAPVQLRASFRAVSPSGTATAPSATAGLSRGWCGQPNASPGAHCLPSRTPTAPNVTGRPKR
jgi:hypothetical protein